MNSPDTHSSSQHSPGSILRAAREQAGMSIPDVAQELRLSSSQVQHLEDDHYEDLPGMTYVRGYLRGYARLLKIDESEVLPPTESAETMPTNSGNFAPVAPRQARSTDRHMRIGTIVVLFAIIGGVVSWWQSRDTDSENLISLTGNREADSAGGAVRDERARVDARVSAAQAEAPRTVTAQAEAPRTVAAQDTGAAEGEQAQLTQDSDSPQANVPAETETVAGPEPASEPEPSSPPVAEAEPVAKPVKKSKTEEKPRIETKVEAQVKRPETTIAARAPQPAPTQSDTKYIVMSFDGTSWVDVRDANDERLLYQSMTQGRTITLQGKPPFRIFLGNAKAVRIRYGGRPVNVAAHQTGLYARFVLGSNQ